MGFWGFGVGTSQLVCGPESPTRPAAASGRARSLATVLISALLGQTQRASGPIGAKHATVDSERYGQSTRQLGQPTGSARAGIHPSYCQLVAKTRL